MLISPCKIHQNLPIGIFDSGMGGLTVLNALMKTLPNESFIYLGDTARLPYGSKSAETVMRYATQMAMILVNQNIKLLVVACNTATTAALPHLQSQFPHIPIIGVVQPGAEAAIATTKNNNIAILATETTIRSGIYQQTLRSLRPSVNLISQSCGLFVALAEEGCINDEIAHAAITKYLHPIVSSSVKYDCVILGCTHFPVLSKPIASLLGDEVALINSAQATAAAVKSNLQDLQLCAHSNTPSTHFLVTDLPERFVRIGEIFLEQPIHPEAVILVDGNSDSPIELPLLTKNLGYDSRMM